MPPTIVLERFPKLGCDRVLYVCFFIPFGSSVWEPSSSHQTPNSFALELPKHDWANSLLMTVIPLSGSGSARRRKKLCVLLPGSQVYSHYWKSIHFILNKCCWYTSTNTLERAKMLWNNYLGAALNWYSSRSQLSLSREAVHLWASVWTSMMTPWTAQLHHLEWCRRRDLPEMLHVNRQTTVSSGIA